MAKIYTRKGDQGKTWFAGHADVPKHDLRLDLCGTLDELNSAIGMAVSFELPAETRDQLVSIQGDLLEIGALLATEKGKPLLVVQRTGELEDWIDQLQAQLSELRNFILPGGTHAAAATHLARSVCRRAERLLARGFASGEVDGEYFAAYVNRLSDYLFVAARYINRRSNVGEQIWRSRS